MSSSDSEDDLAYDRVSEILSSNKEELPDSFIEKMKILKIARHEAAGYNYKDVVFTVVGMRFYGHHVFRPDDNISLEKEDDNPKDRNAIKVIVNDKHVAYVAREDAVKLRKVEGFETAKIVFVRNLRASTDLKLVIQPEGWNSNTTIGESKCNTKVEEDQSPPVANQMTLGIDEVVADKVTSSELSKIEKDQGDYKLKGSE